MFQGFSTVPTDKEKIFLTCRFPVYTKTNDVRICLVKKFLRHKGFMLIFYDNPCFPRLLYPLLVGIHSAFCPVPEHCAEIRFICNNVLHRTVIPLLYLYMRLFIRKVVSFQPAYGSNSSFIPVFASRTKISIVSSSDITAIKQSSPCLYCVSTYANPELYLAPLPL